MKLLLHICVYGLLLIMISVVLANRPDYFGNVGFLIMGAILGIYPAFLIEEFRQHQRRKNLSLAVFQELANRVARCCFDFEVPWHGLLMHPQEIPVFRARKFTPEPPLIYPSTGAEIAHLAASQAIIDFYIFLAAWRRDIKNVVDEIGIGRPLGHDEVRFLAQRLRQTLRPGQRALEELAPSVPDADEIERRAIAEMDRLFPDVHANAGKTVRERIRLVLSETEDKSTAK